MTDLEPRLRRELTTRARHPRPAAALPAALGTAVTRRRRRDRLLLGVSVVALLALVATGVVSRLSGDEDSTPVVTGPDGGAGQWVPMPESPLSPRTRALAFTIDNEAYLVGGQLLCPEQADCAVQSAVDGAAYDPAEQAWRDIADLPVELTDATAVVMDGRAYVWGEYVDGVPCPSGGGCSSDAFLAYDPADDSWTSLSLPSESGFDVNALQASDAPPRLTTDGERIVASVPDSTTASADSGTGSGATELAYEPPVPACSPPGIGINCRGPWQELPVDPLRPAADRAFVGHHGDLYLLASQTGGSTMAVLRHGTDTWERLPAPPADGLAWYVVGGRLVSPSPGPTSGVPPEVLVSAPPAAVYEIRAARWVDPPALPFDSDVNPAPSLARLPIVAGPRLVTVAGLLLDLDARAWTGLPEPVGLAPDGQAATWVGDTLVVWGGQSADGEASAAGATWTPGPAADESATPDGTSADGWAPMADGPLPAVDQPIAATLGDEVVLMGGGPACPASADCGPPSWNGSTDAAAYDPATDTWRSIAPLPHTVDEARTVAFAGRLYVWAWYWCNEAEEACNGSSNGYVDAFWAYDPDADAWATLTPPPDATVDASRDDAFGLTTDGRQVIAFASIRAGDEQDVAYDPAGDDWSPLPVDPLRPSSPRTVVGVGRDLYLFATDDADPTDTQVAVLREGASSWEPLAPSPALADPYWYGIGWYRVGDLVVRPSPGPPDDDGRNATTSTGLFDTAANTWGAAPPRPADPPPYDTAVLRPVAGERLVEVAGYVLDASRGTWTPLAPTDLLADGGAAGAWVGDTLVMWGGADSSDASESARGATWKPSP